jgi:hypothetical protein
VGKAEILDRAKFVCVEHNLKSLAPAERVSLTRRFRHGRTVNPVKGRRNLLIYPT